MIQLKKSTTSNSFAFYPEVEVSSSVDTVRFNYVQDMDKSSGYFDGSITSKLSWVVGTVSGSDLPNPSGQYTLDIYELIQGASQIWNLSEEVFSTSTVVWNEGSADILGQLLTVERSYIEGGNGVTLTTYNSPDETGTYTTYNS